MAASLTANSSNGGRRRVRDRVFWGLCILAFVLIAAPTLSVIISITKQAWPALGWHLLTQDPNSAGGGGIKNAIQGTLLLLLGVLVIGGTIGVAGGVYLAEYGSGRHARVLRFLSEILAGTPSIVIGYVGYVALVDELHWHYSLLAGLLALSVLVLPYIVKTTEVALRSVPSALREASAGLGLTRNRTVARILLPTALPGIVSGLIVALAISTGETAPLLFTVSYSPSAPVIGTHMFLGNPLGFLNSVTYNDISQPGNAFHSQAAAAAFVSLVILLILIIAGRIVSNRARRKTARMAL
jgi:phosphate transport system permease protein